jgi:hypothetical protein
MRFKLTYQDRTGRSVQEWIFTSKSLSYTGRRWTYLKQADIMTDDLK